MLRTYLNFAVVVTLGLMIRYINRFFFCELSNGKLSLTFPQPPTLKNGDGAFS